MSSNAWDRAQRAITRAEERDADVVTPDNAVSPFDASATTIIPTPALPPGGRSGRHQRPDAPDAGGTSQDAGGTPQDAGGRRPPRLGERRRPPPRPGRVPVRPVPAGATTPGADADADTDTNHLEEPPTVELASDAPTVGVAASPDAAPGPGSAPRPSAIRTSEPSPGTAPFAAADHDAVAGTDRAVGEAPAHRSWWKRLFGG